MVTPKKPAEPATTLTSPYRSFDEDGRLRGAVSSPAPVTIINGRYVLERRLGIGGMAEVFLAKILGAEGFSRAVALKRVLEPYSADPNFAAMFIAEAQLTARLVHPNIVSVIDFNREEGSGRLFLVLELVDGVDLHKLLESGPLPFSLVVHLAIEILRGLEYAHELPQTDDDMRGVVHRDLSPHNVLLSWEGTVKVSDFGIAKAHAATQATASLVIKGKPAYMSPEQANCRALDGRSDLFAVGAIMFEALCGRRLFDGDNVAATVGQMLFSDIPNVRAVRPDVPEDLAEVIAGLLRRDPAERTASASAAIAALAACRDYPPMGREQLVAILAQRFADRAPMRPRTVSHSSHAAPTLLRRPTAATVLPPDLPTVVDRPQVTARPMTAHGTPVTLASGLGSTPVKRRWPRLLAASLLVFAIAGVVTAAVARLTANEHQAEPVEALKPPVAAPTTVPPPVAPRGPAPSEPASLASAQAADVTHASGVGVAAPLAATSPPVQPREASTGNAPAGAVPTSSSRPARKPSAPPAPKPPNPQDGIGVLDLDK